jgi:hypothetical protein
MTLLDKLWDDQLLFGKSYLEVPAPATDGFRAY